MGITSLSEFLCFITLFVDLVIHLLHSFCRECSKGMHGILFILFSEVRSTHHQQISSVLSKMSHQIILLFLTELFLLNLSWENPLPTCPVYKRKIRCNQFIPQVEGQKEKLSISTVVMKAILNIKFQFFRMKMGIGSSKRMITVWVRTLETLAYWSFYKVIPSPRLLVHLYSLPCSKRKWYTRLVLIFQRW